MDVYFTPSDVRARWSPVTWVVVKSFTWQPHHVIQTLDRFSSKRLELQLEPSYLTHTNTTTTTTTTGAKLSHTEMNVIKTMIAVIICFMACWSVGDIVGILLRMGVSSCVVMLNHRYHRLNGSSSPVLTATCLSYWRLCDFLGFFSRTDQEVTPLDRF